MVERLPGVDAGFLYMETPTLHMHTLKIALVDVSTAPGGYSFARVQEELAARLHLLPPFRRRIVQVPLQLHHPVWVEDRDFDQSLHVRRQTIPAPGSMRDLEQLIGELAGTPLDRSRPLWEIHVCEGLADGRIAVVTKMHHAVADGSAANALLANIMDLVPDAVPSLPAEPWQGEPTPRRRELLRDAVIAWFRQLAWLPALLLKTARSVRAVIAHKRRSTVPTPRPLLDTPRTSFNGHITARRSFATASLSLEDFKKVKTAHAVTLNDVVLAVVSGAMRTWMAGHGEHPKSSLVAGVPVSTDTGGVVRLVGNRVSNLFTSLHTDVDDPVERLLAIARTTAEAKVVQRTLGLDMLESWVQYTPPAPFTAFMRAYSALRGANLHPAPFNLVVSNVPGPPVPVHIAGARLDALFSVGPILQGIGLNITVWSYLERMNFSALTCPDTLPDVHVLMAGLEPALAELLAHS